MPVVSPSRYSTTTSSTINSLSSTFRSSLNPSSLDKPYYRSSSGTYVTSSVRSNYGDRATEFRSRFLDTDGKRERKSSITEYRSSRAPSVTESDSGISSRYRSDSRSRELSLTRSDSAKGSNSDPLPRNPAGTLARRNVASTALLASSAADLYSKYSPANYIPLAQRLSTSSANQSSYGEISRSKSISNDIGRPPAADSRSSRKGRGSVAVPSVTEHRPLGKHVRSSSSSSGYKESSPSYRRPSQNGTKDSNGNDVQQSVAEIRKRFDPKMTVTKLPANDARYARTSMENYMNQLKSCQNGTTSFTKVLPKDDSPVPVHLPSLDKAKFESRSRSNSNSDASISKTISEPVSIAKTTERNGMSTSLTGKLPSERVPLAVKSQLDPNNPIGKILEKSTVIQVEGADAYKKYPQENVTSIEVGTPPKEQKVAPKHTSNFASYIQISRPIVSGTSSRSESPKRNGFDSEPEKIESPKLKYIDDDNRLVLENDIDSPGALNSGFENKTFEHENYLMKRGTDEVDFKGRLESLHVSEDEDSGRKMETSTESTSSDLTEDSSPETPMARRNGCDGEENAFWNDKKSYLKALAAKRHRHFVGTGGGPPANIPPLGEWEERMLALLGEGFGQGDVNVPVPPCPELAGGRSGAAGRRSESRSDPIYANGSPHGASKASGLNGLRNIGNTCFMNSVLQCLSNTKPLLEYIAEDKLQPDINSTLSCMKGALIKAFATVIKELWREGDIDCVVNTTALKSQVQRFAPRFMGYSQQDAQEFLRYLLEGLHEDVNRVTVRPKPILTEIDESLSDSAKAAEAWQRYLRMEESRVGDIFMGQLKSTLRCTHCQRDSVTFDPFWDLSLPIPSRTGNLKLQQCLAHFTREEELDGDEKPTCSRCGVRRKCLKWFTVQKFPRVLVLHLKRFSPTERFRGKLNVLVEFPLTGLDMSPYAATRGQEATYNLYAVSNHSGTTYSGHYTAYCKHPYTGDWHEYNDSRVSTISPRNVVSSEAYVLFYELTSAHNA